MFLYFICQADYRIPRPMQGFFALRWKLGAFQLLPGVFPFCRPDLAGFFGTWRRL
jgi:hypothetical protein